MVQHLQVSTCIRHGKNVTYIYAGLIMHFIDKCKASIRAATLGRSATLFHLDGPLNGYSVAV